jgi:xanthine dehydrogenase YagT iron-sulfur-binding subunit
MSKPRWTRRRFLVSTALAGSAVASLPALQGRAQSGAVPPAGAAPGPSTGVLVPVELSVNGGRYPLLIDPRVTLLDALREHIGLAGTKKGCDMGACGACTVLSDGRRINACLTLAVRQQGKEIVTIEGLAQGDRLHPMQQAFLEHDGFQCGYCTSGQIMSAVGLIQEGRAVGEAAIREHMSGNICRCGAYPNIVDAIKTVAATQAASAGGGN